MTIDDLSNIASGIIEATPPVAEPHKQRLPLTAAEERDNHHNRLLSDKERNLLLLQQIDSELLANEHDTIAMKNQRDRLNMDIADAISHHDTLELDRGETLRRISSLSSLIHDEEMNNLAQGSRP